MAKNFWIIMAFLQFAAPAMAGSGPVAGTQGFSIGRWDTGDGLPQNAIFAIAQTHDGYLWLGTRAGLARFDGAQFKVFDESNVPELENNRIMKLLESRSGELWIGTEGARLIRAGEGRMVIEDLEPRQSSAEILSMSEDPAGLMWTRLLDGRVYRYVHGKGQLIMNGCAALAQDLGGVLWVGSPDGRLFGLGPISTNATSAFAVSYEIPVGKLDFLQASARGGYWRFANGQIEKWNKDHRELSLGDYPWHPGIPVVTACEDRDGNLIVGTYGEGVWWFDSTGKNRHLEGLPHSFIVALAMDREGDLWVGSNGGGLNQVKKMALQALENSGGTVQSIAVDAQGVLWIAYNGQNRVDRLGTNGLQRFTVGEGIADLAIRSVFVDRKQNVWAGTFGGGLFRLSGTNFVPVEIPKNLSPAITVLFEDRQGSLWVGTQNGLGCLTNGQWKVFTTRDGISAPSITALAEDSLGALWIGTEGGGLNRLYQSHFDQPKPDDGLSVKNVRSIYVDKAGTLWIATSSGLLRHDAASWTRFSKSEGLKNNNVGYVLEDALGYLWLGSAAGLARAAKADLDKFATRQQKTITFREYGEADGLPSSECTFGSQPAACRTHDGKLWFPTIKGVATVDPSAILRNTNPPPVQIESVRIDGQGQREDALRSSTIRGVTVPPRKESVEIDYTSLNLRAPGKGKFRYKLEGFDSDWIERPASVRSVRYSRLAPRQYVFRVTACNEDNEWNLEGSSVVINVLPPFWQKTWFLVFSALFVVGIVVISVYYASTQRLQRQLVAFRQQEAVEKERARIARDLHDQLGANLTQVALLGELAETDKAHPEEVEAHARQISHTARDTTRALDEIVWTVNPSNDTLDDLVNYICKYAQEYLALAGLRYRLDVPAHLPAIPISPDVRHNLFLVAKEAINNIVKHSKAETAWLRLEYAPGSFVLEIEDNGKGISAADQEKGRNGLVNMRQRLEDVGGTFEILARPEGGTKIRLKGPLKDARPKR